MDPDYERDEDRAVARLLSGRGSLSRPEHESIAAAVLQATAAEVPTAAPTRWWWSAGIAAVLAVGLALWLVPPSTPPETGPDFVARGAAEGPQLELRCEPGCRPGAHVVLEVADAEDYGHVAVFAFREDGVAIWYAPASKDGHSVGVPGGARGLLPFRIELDDAHPAGRYEVVALFSDQPLDRDGVRSAYEARPHGVAVVERTLEVEP